jgi:hypothetical protein
MIYRSESRQQSINNEHTSIVMTITEKSSARAGMTEGCGKERRRGKDGQLTVTLSEPSRFVTARAGFAPALDMQKPPVKGE